MGYTLEFGPANDGLSLGDAVEHPADWESWKGSRRLGAAQLDALVKLINEAGLSAHSEAGQVSVAGTFESFWFAADGGWLSKPSADANESAGQWDLLVKLCDLAGWVIYDPQSAALIHAPQFVLSESVPMEEGDFVAQAVAALRSGQGDLLDAVTTLRRLGGAEASELEALAFAIGPQQDVTVRREAAAGIRDAGRGAVVVLSSLSGALADSDPQVRALAAQALGQLGFAARSALPQLRAMSSDAYAPRLAAAAAVQLIERAPEPTMPRSSKPSATAEGEFVEAKVVFAGPNLVVAKTPNGNNVTLRVEASGLAKDDIVRVSINPDGHAREVELRCGDGSWRRIPL